MKPLCEREIANLKQDHLTPEGFCEIRWNDYGDAPRTKQDDGPRHVRLSPPPLATFADNDRIVADISMTRRRKGLGRCKRRRASAYWAVLVSPCERANSGQKSLGGRHGCVALSWCFAPDKLIAVDWMPSLCWEWTLAVPGFTALAHQGTDGYALFRRIQRRPSGTRTLRLHSCTWTQCAAARVPG